VKKKSANKKQKEEEEKIEKEVSGLLQEGEFYKKTLKKGNDREDRQD
jgi:hypothetical protein